MQFSNILVSFIIPHKNIPDLLYRCVSSIPQRNDIEIIIVDDNSSPEIVDFNKFPYINNPNLKVIFDKSGKKQGHARNIGLDNARGEWIFFIDSDDFFLPSINRAIEYCSKSKSDIIYYKSINLHNESYLPVNTRSSLTNNSVDAFLSKEEWGEHMIRYRHPVPWCKFIKYSLIQSQNIKFPEIHKSEDFEFSYLCGHYANKIEAFDIALYCVTTRTDNVTSIVSQSDLLVVAENQLKFLNFMSNVKMRDTPAYKIVEQDTFSIIERLLSDRSNYEKIFEYLKSYGFKKSYVRRMLVKIKQGKRNSKILKNLKRIKSITESIFK